MVLTLRLRSLTMLLMFNDDGIVSMVIMECEDRT